jgi:hypothetical protein
MTAKSATFSLLKGEYDGLPFIAMISSELRDYQPRDSRPWFLGLSAPLSNPTAGGFPTNEEAEDLNQWEDSIGQEITAQCKHVFVGRVTWKAHRELLYYIDEPERAVKSLQKLIDTGRMRPFAFRCEQDSQWKNASIFLQA